MRNKDWKQIEKEYGRCLRTYTGKMFDAFDPDPEMICIEDIAHALSNLCRFAGHVPRFYSVAEHSIYASRLVKPENMFAALMHDAAEAYVIDLPRPIKKELPEYSIMEDKVMRSISKKFGFAYPFAAEIHEIDRILVELEFRNLMLKETKSYQHIKFNCLTPGKAKDLFLDRFLELKKSGLIQIIQ